MSTGAEFTNFVFKRLLTHEDFKDRLLDFLIADIRETTRRVFDSDGTFTPSLSPIVPTGAGAGLMDFIQSPDEDYRGTDGLGNILSLGETGSEDAGAGQIKTGMPFENTAALTYWFSLQRSERPLGIQINPRSGLPEFERLQEVVGVAADADSVVDNGGSITLVCDSACEAGHSHAGRQAVVYLKTPVRGAITEAIAIETITVTWNGVNNRVTTSAIFGQTVVSLTPADYTVVLLGPSVRKVDTSALSGHWFLGVVVGTGGAAGTATVTAQRLIQQSLVSLLDYPGGPAWADGTTNPATTIIAQLTKIVTDLTSTTGLRGLGKLSAPGRGNWHDLTTNPATTADVAVSKIIADLVGAAGADRIGAAPGGNLSAGSIQDQLGELDTEKGGLSLANIWTLLNDFREQIAVGNGNNTTTADAGEARMVSTVVSTATSNRTLLWEFTNPAETEKLRLYWSNGGGAGVDNALEVTVNAVYDAGTSQFNKDATGRAGIVVIAKEGIYARVRKTTALGAWGDTSNDWDGGSFKFSFELGFGDGWQASLDNGRIQFTNTGALANPLVGTAPGKNTQHAKNVVKAWGHFFASAVTPTIDDGYNFSTCVYNGGDIDVTYHTAMAAGQVQAPIAQISGVAAGAEKQFVEVFNKTLNGFSCRLIVESASVGGDANTKLVQLSFIAALREVGFIVCGRQD